MQAQLESRSVERTYTPEECPYETVIIDVTHRCNMACLNCYIPNRKIPDLDRAWLSTIFARRPRGRYIRLVGAEPTMRSDLFDLIRDIRTHDHHPVLLTNGLKLADRGYVRDLKRAGLRVAYLSFNGGFNDDLYEAIDNMRCAERKARAFENLAAENLYTSIGMILVRGLNESEVAGVLPVLRTRRTVREFHLRSIGAMGRYMLNPPFSLSEMLNIFAAAAGVEVASLGGRSRTPGSYDLRLSRLQVRFRVWPDLDSPFRGRLTPEGMVAPFMEHVLANEGGY
jgi:molybdenum cofactor biosynthesis enzyme MoaA